MMPHPAAGVNRGGAACRSPSSAARKESRKVASMPCVEVKTGTRRPRATGQAVQHRGHWLGRSIVKLARACAALSVGDAARRRDDALPRLLFVQRDGPGVADGQQRPEKSPPAVSGPLRSKTGAKTAAIWRRTFCEAMATNPLERKDRKMNSCRVSRKGVGSRFRMKRFPNGGS
jgi:hypothetical protein